MVGITKGEDRGPNVLPKQAQEEERMMGKEVTTPDLKENQSDCQK